MLVLLLLSGFFWQQLLLCSELFLCVCLLEDLGGDLEDIQALIGALWAPREDLVETIDLEDVGGLCGVLVCDHKDALGDADVGAGLHERKAEGVDGQGGGTGAGEDVEYSVDGVEALLRAA